MGTSLAVGLRPLGNGPPRADFEIETTFLRMCKNLSSLPQQSGLQFNSRGQKFRALALRLLPPSRPQDRSGKSRGDAKKLDYVRLLRSLGYQYFLFLTCRHREKPASIALCMELQSPS